MKIHFISPFFPYRGGISQFSDELKDELIKKNSLVKINYKRLYPSFLFPGKSQFVEGIKNAEESVSNGIDSLNPFSGIKISRLLNKDSKDNVLLSVYWMSFFSPVLSLIAFLSSKKVKKVALIHNLIPHEKRFFDRFLTKIFVNQQDGFVVLSKKVKDDILEMKPNAIVKELYHPLYERFGDKVDKNEARKKINVPRDKTILLFFGLVRDYKGLDVLLKSLKELDDDFYLIIAGECYGDFKKYQEIIDQFDLSNRILHLDRFISDVEVSLLFSAADICVLPYKTATQSGVTATALHFEIPIVSTRVGGLAEYIVQNETGVLVSPNNCLEFSEAVISLKDKSVREKMLPNIRVLKQELSWEKFSKELVSFINSI